MSSPWLSGLIVFSSLFAFGCGGSVNQDQPTNTVVAILPEQKPQAVDTTHEDEPIETRAPVALRVESPDECLQKMREGRGLSPDELASEAGQRYLDALARERGNQLNEARKRYLNTIQHFPTSHVIPLAYFAFGELFYAEAQSDPMKIALADQSFKEVMKYPAPDNTSLAFAYFRQSQIQLMKGDGPAVLNVLVKLEYLAESLPMAQCAISLLDASRENMVRAYAIAGQPERAATFFSKSIAKHGSAKINALDMIADLCDLYIRQQKPEDATEALLGVTVNRAPSGYCSREERIIETIAPAVGPTKKAKLARAHEARCDVP